MKEFADIEHMKLVECTNRLDGYKWECRTQISGKSHKVELSTRKASWFDNSNLSLEEILRLTYWWCRDMKHEQICHELNIASQTAVDWDSFCR